jgi:hypothetical protein
MRRSPRSQSTSSSPSRCHAEAAIIHDYRNPETDDHLWRAFVAQQPDAALLALTVANSLYAGNMAQKTAFLKGASLTFRVQQKADTAAALSLLFTAA